MDCAELPARHAEHGPAERRNYYRVRRTIPPSASPAGRRTTRPARAIFPSAQPNCLNPAITTRQRAFLSRLPQSARTLRRAVSMGSPRHAARLIGDVRHRPAVPSYHSGRPSRLAGSVCTTTLRGLTTVEIPTSPVVNSEEATDRRRRHRLPMTKERMEDQIRSRNFLTEWARVARTSISVSTPKSVFS